MQVGPGARHLCIAAIAGRSADGRKAQELRQQADALMRGLERERGEVAKSAFSMAEESFAGQEQSVLPTVRDLRKRAGQLAAAAEARVLANVDVVAGTCAAAASRDIAGARFPLVIVDEAAQATQASTLLPLVRGAECFVLAGDQMQLPPTLLSEEARASSLSKCAPPACAAVRL